MCEITPGDRSVISAYRPGTLTDRRQDARLSEHSDDRAYMYDNSWPLSVDHNRDLCMIL